MIQAIDEAILEGHLQQALKRQIRPLRFCDLIDRLVNIVCARTHVGREPYPTRFSSERRLVGCNIPLVEASLLIMQANWPKKDAALPGHHSVKRLGHRFARDSRRNVRRYQLSQTIVPKIKQQRINTHLGIGVNPKVLLPVWFANLN